MDYDPLHAPDPQAWLALEEQERIDLALAFHSESGDSLPNIRLHAVIHVVVESQVAEAGDQPAAKTLHRLMSEGLDRHQAIHAIGSEVARYIIDLYRSDGGNEEIKQEYGSRLEKLTAQSWLAGGG